MATNPSTANTTGATIQTGPAIIDSVADIMTKLKLGTPEQAINSIQAGTAYGPTAIANSNFFYGINHRQTPAAIQSHKDFFGLTFFTRPCMNFTDVNLRGNRVLTQFLTSEANSIPRILRMYLDYKLASTGIKSDLMDNQEAFIPILTNALESISGWPDIAAPVWTSTPGAYKEEFGFVDGVTEIFSSYDITATFRNTPGNPIILLMHAWLWYASLVFQGVIVPYPEFIVEREIDYMTRIYRLVLDVTKTKVQGIAACGAGLPLNVPIGAIFNYDHEHPINPSNDHITINFKCFGAIYNDPILIYEFNQTVIFFNGGMADANRTKNYTMIPFGALQVFNHKGYPRINPDTYVLEWWIDNATYKTVFPIYSNLQQYSQVSQQKLK